MENEQQDPGISLFQLNLDASNSYTLRSAASWSKVLGITGSIVGFMITCFFIYMLVRPEPANDYNYRGEGFDQRYLTGGSQAAAKVGYWIFIISGLIFMIGGLFSFQFGNKMSIALRSNDQDRLDRAFGSLRNYFAFRSIIVIILLLLFLLVFASAI